MPRTLAKDSASRRGLLFTRTALCGALGAALALSASAAWALPEGGFAEVNAGGGAPVISPTDNSLNIQLNAPRTVLSWTTYNVTPDQTVTYNFGARNWVVLNKIIGLQPSKIEGAIVGKVGSDFGGNIWFVSQNSIIFGKTAQVDAGGLLVALGTPNTQAFLDASNNLFSFQGGDVLPDSKIFVLAGGKLNGHGGLVAFAGPSIITRANATVTASDGGSVLYGAAKTFQIRMAPGTGGDFDLVDFIVPDISGGTDAGVAADLAGATRGNSVFVAAVSKSAIGGAVVNVEGLITAQAAKADGGDIILSGGGGITNRVAGPTVSGAAGTDMYLNKGSASRDLQVQNVGKIFGRPWVRPPEAAQDPTTLQQDADANQTPECAYVYEGVCIDPDDEYFCYYFPDAPGCSRIIDEGDRPQGLFDVTAISAITSGRDAKIQSTASVELGRIVAGRDLSVSGPNLKANSLIASGAVTARTTQGPLLVSGIGAGRESVVEARGDVQIDAITSPQRLTITGNTVTLGDATGSISGLISVSAQNVSVNALSAKLDTISATNSVRLGGGAVEVSTVTAPKLFAQASSVKIGTANSTGDIYAIATSGDASIGVANAGDDVFVIATHGTASLTTANLSGAAFDGVSSDFAGNPDAAGNGRLVRVESTDLDAKLGLGTGGVTGATAITVRAGQDAAIDVIRETPAATQVVALRDATLKAPTVRLDAVSAGRDLTLGSTTGDFTLTQSLSAVRNISITAAGALRVGDVRADQGSVSLTGGSINAGNVAASEDLILKATSAGVTTTSFKAGRDLIVQGLTLSLGSSIGPVARDLSITSLGSFTAAGPLSAGRNLTIDVAGTANLGQTSAVGLTRIVANDLVLTGTLTAANAQIESRTGAMQVGGSGGGSGLVFDSTEFGQLHVTGVAKFYAGSTTGTQRGDLVLQTLSINPTNTPSVAFLVGSGNNALVQGAVAPTTSGGILRIGDATDLTWRPGSILVSGALGTATYSGGNYTDVHAFNELRLAARQDILMGSPRFISLIQGTAIGDIDIAAGRPQGVGPAVDEQFKIFAATGRLEVSAENKVVQQNTAPFGGTQTSGLFLTGAANPALIIDPPKLIELYGAFNGSDGKPVNGQQAGSTITFQVVDASGNPTAKPSDANYKFNSCSVGTSTCATIVPSGGTTAGGSSGGSSSGNSFTSQISSGVLTARDGLGPNGTPGGGPTSGPPNSAEGDGRSSEEQALAQLGSDLANPPVLLGVAPVDSDEIVTDPVTTGAGSEEIWRQNRQKK